MRKTGSIAVAVVIYNEFCGNSRTCMALESVGFPVVVFDNSTEDQGNEAYCQLREWKYLGGTGNVGLSKAYNSCVQYVKASGCAQFLCLFDDDTDLDMQYFSLLQDALVEDRKIYVPIVYSKGQLLSPCLVDSGHKARRFKNEDQLFRYTGAELSAINSGMALDISLFDDYQYDENIFLDGIDHKFLMDMKDRGEEIILFPYRCDHSFSGEEKPDFHATKKRFETFVKDYQYILRDRKLAYGLLVGKRALKLALQYKKFSFICEFLK